MGANISSVARREEGGMSVRIMGGCEVRDESGLRDCRFGNVVRAP